MTVRTCGSFTRRVLAAALAAALGGCAMEPSPDDSGNRETVLRNNLAVAEAALAAGQPAAGRRLYLSLADRFGDAPEPQLGLGRIAFAAADFAAAERHFLRAAELADGAPAVAARAWLGAGRTALATGRIDAARGCFRAARDAGRGLPAEAWAANGLAVAATIGGRFEAAEASYGDALRLSSGHPRISANFVRMLIAAGRADDAARIYARHDSSHWLDGDGAALARLIEDARRAAPRLPAAGLAMRLSPSGAGVTVKRFDPAAPSGLAMRLPAAPDPGPQAPPAAVSAEPPPPAETAPPPPAGPAEAAARRRDRTAPTMLALNPGKGRRLRLGGEATSVLVASPEIADVQLLSPKVLYVIGKTVGRTSVAVLGDRGRVRDWIVSVVLDLDPVREVLARDPQLRGVRAARAARGIALSGEVASVELSERALRLAAGALPEDTTVENELRVTGAQQVNLEVQIAEVQRSVTEEIGINWQGFRTFGATDLGFEIGRPLPVTIDPTIPRGLILGSTEIANTPIRFVIDMLARAGQANVLARPNITAVSGESASFFSGGEYPLPTGFEDGVIVFTYKKYGVLLDFVPTVVDGGRIVLNVRPEVSEPSPSQIEIISGVTVPVINVRRAETTVEVEDGESIVIGGLFRNASDTRETGVPVLKDFPVFGHLFGHRSIRSEELELIVIVTARLVAGPASGDAEPPPPRQVEGYYY